MAEVPEVQDRALSYLLASPEHMAALIQLAAPDLALRIDADSLTQQETTLVPEELRKRVEDVLYEGVIDGDDDLRLLVLVAHQSAADPLLAVRLLIAEALLYDADLRQQQEAHVSRPRQRVRHVIPLVLHTGRRPWTVPAIETRFRDIKGLEGFIPRFDIIPLDLAAIEEEALLAEGNALACFLNLFRAQYDEADAFARSLTKSLQGLKKLARDRTDLASWLRFALRFASLRRGHEERDSMVEVVKTVIGEDDPNMIETIAEAWRLEGSRALLLKLIALRFPEQSARDIGEKLESLTDAKRLEELGARLMMGELPWDELWTETE